jgi:hypothetical protein
MRPLITAIAMNAWEQADMASRSSEVCGGRLAGRAALIEVDPHCGP